MEDLQQRFIPRGRTVLDLGCGYGDFINQVQAASKLAVDINEQAAQYLTPEVAFFAADVSDMPFLDDESVDTCFASNLLEHVSKQEASRVLHEVRRVLRPRGLVILVQPNFRYCYRNYFDDYTHETIYTDESLCGLLSANGFLIKYRRPRYLPFSLQSRLPKSYWITRLYLKLRIPLLAKQMLVVAEKD